MALPLISQTELVDQLADKTGWTKGDVKTFLAALTDVIEETVKGGKRMRICGIQVEPKVRAATKSRMGRNPRTGEAVKIAAKPASVKLGLKAVNPLKAMELPSVKKLTGGTDTKKSSKKNSKVKSKVKKKGRK